ncbi:GNAT family N-acetyltransferase [Vibrio fluminensis]|uniref:GNAT family N-acetyltransferase n=1 Tax=Vibrio fluminensis TaxID=2783614 RepID=UPI001E50AC07|nr:GNAT family protein [Vibrio fluminensis]
MTNQKKINFLELKQGKAVALSETLTIELIKPSDLAEIIEMLNDDRVNPYLYFAPADNSLYEGYFNPLIESTQQAISTGEWGDSLVFVMRDLEGRYMGMTAVTAVMFLAGNYEVGYQLPFHAWGQGIATRACQLMTEIGFNQLGAHKISADCYAANVGSYKTLEKCGFKQEGRQQDYYKTQHGFDDKLYYGMTQAEFSQI